MNKLGRDKIKILITRPAGQQAGFARRCQALGLETLLLPCLTIEYPSLQKPPESLIAPGGIILFTSANAVRSVERFKRFPWPGVVVHAIGKATASALEACRQPVTLIPPAPHNSEAYIEHIKHLPPQQLLIVKGYGGRTLIHDSLVQLGWNVTQADVYRRVSPTVDKTLVDRIFRESPPELLSVTSDEVLTNFLALTTDYQPALFQSQLIVNSQRCAQKAIKAGFSHRPLIGDPPGDDGQLICIQQWLEKTGSM